MAQAQLSLKKVLAKLLDNKAMIDRFYPVGSYYETSNTSFNPNTAWGGTWVKEAEGNVHVSAGSTYTAGSSYGSNTHTHTTGDVTLTVNQIPAHRHTFKSTYGSNTAIIYGKNVGDGGGNALSAYNNYSGKENQIEMQNTGGGQKHNHGATGSTTRNSWQPSIAVVRWHRTA